MATVLTDPSSTKQNVSRKTIKGFFWSFFGTGFQAILRIIILMILSRLLNPLDFGIASVATIIIGFTNIVTDLGINAVLIQRPVITRNHIRAGFTISILFGGFLAIILWIAAPIISSFFRMDQLATILRVIVIGIPVESFSCVSGALIARDLQFKRLAIMQVVTYGLGYGGVGVILSILGFGVWALIGATLGQAILYSVITFTLHPFSLKPKIDKIIFKEFLFFGGGFTVAQIGNYVATNGDNLVVGRFLGAVDLGLYGRAYQLMSMPAQLIGSSIDTVMFPILARLQDDLVYVKSVFRRAVLLIALLIIPLSVIVIILAPEIIILLLGESWRGAIVPFQILTAGMFFRTAYKMSDSLTRALGAVYSRAWRQWVYSAAVIIGALAGQFWGVRGVAFGVLIALTIHFALNTSLSLKLIAMTWIEFLKTQFPAICLSTIIGMEIWAISSIMRQANIYPIIIIGASGLATIMTFLAFALLPEVIIGSEIKAIINKVRESIRGKNNIITRLTQK